MTAKIYVSVCPNCGNSQPIVEKSILTISYRCLKCGRDWKRNEPDNKKPSKKKD